MEYNYFCIVFWKASVFTNSIPETNILARFVSFPSAFQQGPVTSERFVSFRFAGHDRFKSFRVVWVCAPFPFRFVSWIFVSKLLGVSKLGV